MYIYNDSHMILSGERKTVYEAEAQKESVLRSGLYRFVGTEEHLCTVNILVNNKPIRLWINNEVDINEELKVGNKIKIEIINNSGNVLIVQVMLKIEEF